MKLLFAIFSLFWALNAYADEIFPAGCRPITVKDESVKLAADKPALIMIHNLSDTELWITHPVDEPNASAGWSSRLQGGNWSALVLNNKSFELFCVETKPGHEQQVPCAGVLGVCEWVGMSIAKEDTGTFWAGENMKLSALTAYIGRRGFVVPATPAP
ncbi:MULTISPECIES: hypothetical protein [Legionella]|uniref:hypothetical protein n=1 Tax=Legionella TaxID=445 RepID=UPI000F8CEF45|nr:MULTISPECIES: hypothetical protein [Legionella]MCP0914784.1 hypothetical protein [Legionella sp. 27cVA30]RUR11448.1 hypothetical protein ELY14_01500 [Legionella septentrionalis]